VAYLYRFLAYHKLILLVLQIVILYSLLIKTIFAPWLRSYATAKKILAGGRGDEMTRSYLPGSQ